MRQNRTIASILAAGLVAGSFFAVPISSTSIAEAAGESGKILNTKSPAETYAEQGDKLFEANKFEEAAEAYKKAAEEGKTNDEYWFRCGQSYFKAGKYKSAKKCFEKAIKLKNNNPNYYGWCGTTYLRLASQTGMLGDRLNLLDKTEKYLLTAERLAPLDSDIQLRLGYYYQYYAKVQEMAIRDPWIYVPNDPEWTVDKINQRSYNHFLNAIESDPNNEHTQEGLSQFLKEHPEFGSMPSTTGEPAVQPIGGGTVSSAAYSPESLQKEANQIQQWMRDGKVKLYNAGSGFEWWDEEARADFEALPFSDDIEEVASHVYRVAWNDSDPILVTYVVIVPRHVRAHYADGDKVFDSLLMVEFANTTQDEHEAYHMNLQTKMLDRCFIKEGRTYDIMHWATWEGDEFTWKWLEEGKQEFEQEEVTSLVTLGVETAYRFEGTSDPNTFILHATTADGESWNGKMVALPDITTPPVPMP